MGTSCSTNGFATCRGVDNATGRYKICRVKGQRETLCDLCVDGKQAYIDYAANSRGFYHDYAKGCDLDPEIPLRLLEEDNIKYKKPELKPEPKCSSAGYATCNGKDSQSSRYKVCRAKTQTLTLCNVCVDGKRAYKSVPVDNRGYYHDYASQCDSDPEIPASLTKQSNLKL